MDYHCALSSAIPLRAELNYSQEGLPLHDIADSFPVSHDIRGKSDSFAVLKAVTSTLSYAKSWAFLAPMSFG